MTRRLTQPGMTQPQPLAARAASLRSQGAPPPASILPPCRSRFPPPQRACRQPGLCAEHRRPSRQQQRRAGGPRALSLRPAPGQPSAPGCARFGFGCASTPRWRSGARGTGRRAARGRCVGGGEGLSQGPWVTCQQPAQPPAGPCPPGSPGPRDQHSRLRPTSWYVRMAGRWPLGEPRITTCSSP